MTTTIAFASDDGQVKSSSTSYNTAQNGANLVATTNGSWVLAGQGKSGATYEIWQSFFKFPFTLPTNEFCVSAHVSLWSTASTTGTGVARTLGMRGAVWDPLATSDWRTPTDLTALTRYGVVADAQLASGQFMYLSEQNLNETIVGSGAHQFVVYSSRFTEGSVPAGNEYNEFDASEASGTSGDPALVFTSTMIHTLVRLSGCQVQLSDGRHVWIEADGGGGGPLLTMKLQDPPAAATNIATNLLSAVRDMGSATPSLQQMTLVRDASDNLYWIGHALGGANVLNVICWKKTGTSTWSERTQKQATMPTAGASGDATINNLAAAWHSVGSDGTIMVVGSHENDAGRVVPNDQMFYALLNCNYLLTGTGSLLRGSGDAFSAGLISANSRAFDMNNYLNEVGTGLDVVSLADTERGVIVSLSRAAVPGDYSAISVCRYSLNSSGATITDVDRDANANWITKDAATKARVLPISSTQFAVVSVDKDSGWGPTIRILQNIGTSSTFTELAKILLDAESIASLPTPANLHASSAWDAAYHPPANEILFWYFDQANGRRLLRTTIDLSTYQAVRNEVEAASAVGASGSTNYAIRVQRGALTASEVIVSVANRTSGGTQSTVYVTDSLNVEPSAPSLVHKGNYDASSGSVFDWTFNDLNVGDSQTAYELEIDNASTGATAVATGKISSATSERNITGGTLTNGIDYRWRVRTWDTSDAVGAWSGYDFFTTSASGSLNITDPASDNPPLILDSISVSWSVSGMTQASYRIRVVNNVTGVQLSDTGFIASTATTATVSGLSSDIEWRIEVTARNAALVSSNTATRLVTPDYNEPEIPGVSATALNDQGHILVQVTNPTPTGDKPEVMANQIQRRLLGASAWTTVGEVGVNGSYTDYAASSGLTYEYRVVGMASTGSATSTINEVTLALEGVWLHRPGDAAGTSINLRFGANQRGGQDTVFSQLTRYAGRELPVADFAEYRDEIVNVVVDIPFGDTWASTLTQVRLLNRTRATIVYRDGRGRHAFGIMNALTDTDMAWGTQMSFDFSAVDYEESVV